MLRLRRQTWLWILLTLVIVALIAVTLNKTLTNPKNWIQRVVISGVPGNKQQQFEQVIKPYLNKNFVDVSLAKVAAACMQFAWVSNVTVRRIWPKSLSIVIKPQKLVAIWNVKNALNSYGEPFPLKSNIDSLPYLQGPKQNEIKVYAMYQQLSERIRSLNLKVTHLNLQADGNWLMQLSNNMQIQLGSKQILTTLSRFVTVYPKVFKKPQSAWGRHVDLRYAHGMAVD